jgi:hypothetical protein
MDWIKIGRYASEIREKLVDAETNEKIEALEAVNFDLGYCDAIFVIEQIVLKRFTNAILKKNFAASYGPLTALLNFQPP